MGDQSVAQSAPRPIRVRRRWFSSFHRRVVPQILQMSSAECGAACLAMILNYYGHEIGAADVRERCGVGRDGLSAGRLVQVARDYGLRVRAISLPRNDLRFVSLPAIVHWEFNHFIVVERWSLKQVDVLDPAAGRLHLTAEEFQAGFTGVVLMLEPGVHFARQRSSQRKMFAYLANYLTKASGAFAQILVASLLLQLFGLALPLLTKIAVDHILPLHMASALVLLGVGLLVLLVAQLLTAMLRAILLAYVQARVDMAMMFPFFEHLISLPLRFFQQRSSGDILARVSSNTVIRDMLSGQVIATLLDGGLVVVYLLLLFWQAPLFGLLALALGLLQVLLLVITNRPIRELSMRELVAQGRTQGYVTEILTGIVSLKAAGAEQRTFEHWSNLFCDQLNASVRRNLVSSVVETGSTLFNLFSPLLLLWFGMFLVLGGSMSVGTMLALNVLAIAFLTPLTSVVGSGQRLQLVRSHLDRLIDVTEAEPEQDVRSTVQTPELTGGIEMRNVSFRYHSQSREVLKDISLRFKPGQRIALVGRTGSGKSTLGKLLLGLYLPTSGEIFYDDLPLRTLNYQAVRAQFGVVMQDATIFSGTIRQNIAFYNPAMDMEQVVRAARLAELHDDILAMPMGYETLVSEQGSALSGGQRQRLALARALAHTPALLLLDEATSALDVVTEQRVEQNLATLGCTQIIIAHRLSTIRHADVILVLAEGKIVEQGTHQDLVRRNGYYASLIQNQFASENAEAETV